MDGWIYIKTFVCFFAYVFCQSWETLIAEENDGFYIYPEQRMKQGFAYYVKMNVRLVIDNSYRKTQLRRIQDGEPPVQQGNITNIVLSRLIVAVC